jgi:hypothetical protein
VTDEPVKYLALGSVRCEVADQSAFGCVSPELFDLRQIVLHRRPPRFFLFPSFDLGTGGSQIKPEGKLGHSPNQDGIADGRRPGVMSVTGQKRTWASDVRMSALASAPAIGNIHGILWNNRSSAPFANSEGRAAVIVTRGDYRRLRNSSAGTHGF